jgi:hypothetical protein
MHGGRIEEIKRLAENRIEARKRKAETKARHEELKD